MGNKEDILQIYLALKDSLEDDDDFEKMHNLIKSMASIDPQKAFDMWYPLLSRYESYVTECQPNATYYLTKENMDAIGAAFGERKFDQIILADNYLYDLLFKRFCYVGNHYNYTQTMMFRAMASHNLGLAEQMFADVFSNGNNDESWFEIMDGFFFDIKVGDYIPNDDTKKLLVKWATKIKDKKNRAKIMSSILATQQNFDLSAFSNSQVDDVAKVKNKDYSTDIVDILTKLLTEHAEALDNRKVLKSMLADYFPNKKLYVNTLMMAYDEGFVEEIRNTGTIDFLAEHRMQMVLVNNFGIDENLSVSVIKAWNASLNKIGGNKNGSRN